MFFCIHYENKWLIDFGTQFCTTSNVIFRFTKAQLRCSWAMEHSQPKMKLLQCVPLMIGKKISRLGSPYWFFSLRRLHDPVFFWNDGGMALRFLQLPLESAVSNQDHHGPNGFDSRLPDGRKRSWSAVSKQHPPRQQTSGPSCLPLSNIWLDGHVEH